MFDRKDSDYKNYYDILELKGNGAFGHVYKATSKEINNDYRAIKVIDLDKIRESLLLEYGIEGLEQQLNICIDGYIKEFENMYLCSKNNNHSVKCYEYFLNKKYFAIVMELCDKNLSQLLTEKIHNTKEGFKADEIYDIMNQLNITFKIMKENKIIHRDLKLENILIKYNDNNIGHYIVKLADYGSSKRLNSLSRNYCISNVGTLIYMAPEILSQKEYNYKSDLWSIGIIIYRLKFGKSPFLGVTEQALINSIQNFNNKTLESFGNKDLDDLIKHLLVKKPNDRYGWEEYLNHPFFKSKSNFDYKDNFTRQKIFQNFSRPSLIGLKNTGGINCMNAVIQCFCHISEFVEYFKFKHHQKIVKNDQSKLSYSFKLLIDNFWAENYDNANLIKYFVPEEFKNKILKMNPIFKGKGAKEPKNLLNFIIMKLHEELNGAKNKNEINNCYVDQRNKSMIFNYYAQNFVKQNKSIISDLFYGANCNITRCCNCAITLFEYQTYFIIVFPLEEVKKFKVEFNNQNNNFNFYFNNNFNNNFNNEVNIYDCFEYYKKSNLMSGANSMFCNYCKANTPYVSTIHLATGAEILIVRFNRKKGSELSNVKINFGETLNLNNYIEFVSTGVNYRLIGVITYIGGSDMNGNYIAYCNDPKNYLWYKYDDEKVTQVNNFQNEIINYGMLYVLFYQKVK